MPPDPHTPPRGPLAGLRVVDLLDRPGRALRHDGPGRPRGRRRQGRAAGGRRDARLGAAVGRRRGRRDPDRGLLPGRQPQQALAPARPQRPTGADVLRRLLVDARRPRRELPARGARSARLRRRRRCGRSTRTSSTWRSAATVARGPAADRPGYDFVIQAVGGLMSITGDADERRRPSDQGRRRDQRRRHRAVRGDRHPRRAAAAARRPAASGSTCRSSARPWRSSSTRPRTRSSTGRSPGRRGNAHPNIVPVRDVRDGRRGDRRGGRVGAAVAALLRGARPAGAGRRPAVRDERRPGRPPRRAAADPRRAVRQPVDVPTGWPRSTRPRSRPAPSPTSSTAFASPEAAALGMAVDVEHPCPGRPSARPASRSTFDATPGSIRTAPPLLGEHTDEVLAEVGFDAADDRAAPGGRRRLGRAAPATRADASTVARADLRPIRDVGAPLLDSAGLDRRPTLEARPHDRRPRALGAHPRRLVRDGRGDRPHARQGRLQDRRHPPRLPGRARPRRGGQGRRSRPPAPRRCTST